ncbi:type I-E CRISPR-associated protein Cse1/CasA [Phycicoccus sp. CSK15P-2]|uniref:type I-E CRISPR-associated protein Cse1/CasA n=1 Tax=Phycicoccus sp. CSK15P-2 TaxID=2807627 RepID=UPI00194EEA30|nr:type I-E CRISPR-associated protein Cse1/CasA [Phycicoccus sp. CSK15P-2]MBM6404835.1 type I-E CRISPR-associated protein Cse1/CasA [Phycicoccus sp. CSK15P-2]
MSFNLLHEPWVPALIGGTAVEVSLGDALRRAHEIDSLDHGDPLVAAATYRLLLALTLAVDRRPGEEGWQARLAAGLFDEAAVDTFASDDGELFDLFHPERPFYQVGGLEALSGRWSSPALLMPEVASGNNVPLFSFAPEEAVPPLSAPVAARRLLACHAFDTAAIKTGAKDDPRAKAGKTTGNPVGYLGGLGFTMPLGRTLFETLALNTPVLDPGGDDEPSWRRQLSAQWEIKQPRGPLELLTWQSRRIRLGTAVGANGEQVVDRVIVAAGDRMHFSPGFEPHTLWRTNKDKGGAAFLPARHQAGRSPWRGLSALLALQPDGDSVRGGGRTTCAALSHLVEAVDPDEYPVDAFVVGVEYGNQSAVVENTIADRVPVPLQAVGDEMLQSSLGGAVEQAELCMRALNGLQANLREAVGGDKIPWDKGERPGDGFVAGLDRPARELFLGVRDDIGSLAYALAQWEHELWVRSWEVADPLLDDAPAATVMGRGAKDFPRRLNTAEASFRAALNKALPTERAARDAEREARKTAKEST